MTIIFQKGGNYWIESFVAPRASVATGASANVDFTLERSGNYLGSSVSLDEALAVADAVLTSLSLRNTDDSELDFGQAITGVRVRKSNGSGGALVFGAKVLVYLRK